MQTLLEGTQPFPEGSPRLMGKQPLPRSICQSGNVMKWKNHGIGVRQTQYVTPGKVT